MMNKRFIEAKIMRKVATTSTLLCYGRKTKFDEKKWIRSGLKICADYFQKWSRGNDKVCTLLS